MESRHFNGKGEEIVDNRVQKLINQGFPRQVLHALHFIIDIHLRGHDNKPENIDKTGHTL